MICLPYGSRLLSVSVYLYKQCSIEPNVHRCLWEPSEVLLGELENPLLYRLKVKQFPLISPRLYYAVTFECGEKERSAPAAPRNPGVFRYFSGHIRNSIPT